MKKSLCSPERENSRSLLGMGRIAFSIQRQVSKGPSLAARVTLADNQRGVVGLIHGYADHAERYDRVADVWARQGISTVAIDLRGHGRSEGRRGHCESFAEYLEDVRELYAQVKSHAGEQPCILFGHSFGGLVATSAVLAEPNRWDALALTGPFFGLALEVPAAKVFAGRIASRLLPTLALPSGLSGKDVTHDAAIAHAYDNDPLVFKTATARWFTEATQAQHRLRDRARQLSLPLWLGFGGADAVASLQAARDVFSLAGSTDKTMRVYEGLFHEILNEPEGLSIAEEIGAWMLARMSA